MTTQSHEQREIVLDDGTIIRTKKDVVEAIRASAEPAGKFDMLSDLMGGNLEEDPLAFRIACELRYYGDMYRVFNCQEESASMLQSFKKAFPEATARALAYKPMSGEAFYAKYGEKAVYEHWQYVAERTGFKLYELLDLENETHIRQIVESGNELKTRIIWCIAGDWLEDLCEHMPVMSIEEIAAICNED